MVQEVWLINGIPGAGKTTLARCLAARLPGAAHVEGDRLQEMILSGSVPPGGEPREEEARQIHLNVRNQCLLARSYAEAGFTPVLDYVVANRDRVREYLGGLDGLALRLVTLAPGRATALRRDRERPEKTVAHLWAHLEEQIERELTGVGLWVDNSRQTIQETADEVLRRAEEAAVNEAAVRP